MDMVYIQNLLPILLKGTLQTIKLFIFTLCLALPIGLPFALGSISKFFIIKLLSKIYIWVFRGTPLMLQLFFIYFGLPMMGIKFDRETAAILTFVLNYSAYFAEIYRAGIQSIDNGQHEAAKTLGYTKWQSMRYIIIPQTIKRIIPPVSNEAITLVKDTALVNAIGVTELLKTAKDAVNRDVDITAYFLAALVYLIFTFILTLISQQLERKYSIYEK